MKVAAFVLILAGALFLTAAPASARGTEVIDHGGTYFGVDVVVEPNQVVQGDVTVVGGSATIAGEVDGDVTVVGGTIDPLPGSVITGQTHIVGNHGFAAVAPWLPAFGVNTIEREDTKLTALLAYSAIVVLIFLIFPVRVRTALDRVERHPGLSAAVGVLALIASVPIALLLFVSLIGWPLLPIELLAYIGFVLIGQAALGLLIGRRLYELIHPKGTPSPLGTLVLGLIVLVAAEILPLVGWIVAAIVWLVGLGAAILAFVREDTFLTASPTQSGPPPSGPPMPA